MSAEIWFRSPAFSFSVSGFPSAHTPVPRISCQSLIFRWDSLKYFVGSVSLRPRFRAFLLPLLSTTGYCFSSFLFDTSLSIFFCSFFPYFRLCFAPERPGATDSLLRCLLSVSVFNPFFLRLYFLGCRVLGLWASVAFVFTPGLPLCQA